MVVSGCAVASALPSATPRHAAPARTPARLPLPPAKVIVRHVLLRDGHLISVARFTGGVKFVLHCGSVDPGPLCPRGLTAGPRVRPASRGLLIAAFNGGFKLSAGVGGYEQEGRIISPLVQGRASLVIYRSGPPSIGIWGHGAPLPGRVVYSVRQNLNLLVWHGHPTRASANWTLWGATLSGGEFVARSALGENAQGQLIYAGSMYASPADLARALVRFGAVSGMELDINPEWVQLAYSQVPGGPLRKGVTGQVRPANQYLVGWTRDFIAVMAVSAPLAAVSAPLAARSSQRAGVFRRG
jgi:hypothetical protein